MEVTKCNKCFDFKTYIYGYQLDSYNLDTLNDIYQMEGVDYEIFGQMRTDLFSKLIDCLKNSKSVKKKYIRAMNK